MVEYIFAIVDRNFGKDLGKKWDAKMGRNARKQEVVELAMAEYFSVIVDRNFGKDLGKKWEAKMGRNARKQEVVELAMDFHLH